MPMFWLWMALVALAALVAWTWSSRTGWRSPPGGPHDTRAEPPATHVLTQDEIDTLPMPVADEDAAERQAAAEAQREAEHRAEQQARREAERLAEQQAEQARLEAARLADEAALRAAYRAAEDEARQREAERRAAETARQAAEAERQAVEAARHEAERQAVEAARHEAERRAVEAARREAQRQAAQALAEQQAREAVLAAEAAAAATAAAAAAAEAAAAQAAAAAAEAARAAAAQRRTPEQTLVMVVDDSKVVRVKTSRLLAKQRYRVALAEEGQDALRQIEAEVPQVLITDVEMPGIDGFELTRHVRNDPRTALIPIIMITSADDRLRSAAAEAGVTVLLGKPYADEELLAHIERHAGVTVSSPA